MRERRRAEIRECPHEEERKRETRKKPGADRKNCVSPRRCAVSQRESKPSLHRSPCPSRSEKSAKPLRLLPATGRGILREERFFRALGAASRGGLKRRTLQKNRGEGNGRAGRCSSVVAFCKTRLDTDSAEPGVLSGGSSEFQGRDCFFQADTTANFGAGHDLTIQRRRGVERVAQRRGGSE